MKNTGEKNTGEEKDRGEGRLNPSTAPKAGETEDADRMEGSFAPGISEYGPGHPKGPETESDRSDEEEEESE